jgi:hypothetical protein
MNREHYFDVRNSTLGEILPDGVDPLSGIDQAHRGEVLEIAVQVFNRTSEWITSYPFMGNSEAMSNRALWCSLYGAATFREGTLSQAVDIAALTMVIFSLDDLMDGVLADRSRSELDKFARTCKAVPFNGNIENEDIDSIEGGILGACVDIFSRFSRYPAYSWAQGYLAGHWARCVEGMRQETLWRLRAAPLPTFEQYIENGAQSIFSTFVSAIFITMWDLSELDQQVLSAWDEANLHIALTIRLYNDLRTAEREAVEGTPNAYSLLLEGGGTPKHAVERLLATAGEEIEAFSFAASKFEQSLAASTRTVRCSTDFSCCWYIARDTHHVTLRELAHLVSISGGSGASR